MNNAIKIPKCLGKTGNVYNNKGFTLVELLTVIALIAILTAVTGPSLLKHIPRYHAKGVTSDMMARLKAIQTNIDHGVRFTLNGSGVADGYATVMYNDDTSSWDRLYGFLTYTDVDTSLYGSGGGACNGTIIVFKPNGRVVDSSGSGTACTEILIETNRGKTTEFLIKIDNFTGNITVETGLRL